LGFVVNGGDFAINGKDLKTGYFTNSGEIRLAFSLALAVDDIPTGSENLSFFTNVFSPVGTTGDVLWGNLGDNSIVGRYEIVAAPIPAAVPLFATALAGIGVIGWLRRKAA
jgi:hypothetical protein